MQVPQERRGTANRRSALRWCSSGVLSFSLVTLVACGDPPVPSPTEAVPAPDPALVPPAVPEVPAPPPPTEASPPAPEPAPIDTTGLEEARRDFVSLLGQLEPVTASPPDSDVPDCVRGCTIENDERLLAVTALSVEEDGTPGHFEVRVLGPEPSVRTVAALGGSDEAWQAYWDEEGPEPWRAALERAIPTIPNGRRARNLVTARAEAYHSLGSYSPLVALGGALEGRHLFAHVARYAVHFYLVHGPEHTMRLVASLPLEVDACDGDGGTTACVAPLGIDSVYSTPGTPALLLRLMHPVAGHGGVGFSTLLVSLRDDDALRLDAAQRDREIEASLVAPGARVRVFSVELSEGEPCDAGCVSFLADRSFAWSFPDRLLDGTSRGSRLMVRARDGTSSEALTSPTAAVREALGATTGTFGRDIIARAAVAAWEGLAYSPVVQLGPPHMNRRLVLDHRSEADVLLWVEGDQQAEVARIVPDPDEPSGPWGIDRVIVPEGAGYPLIVVAVAALPRTRVGVEHRVRPLLIPRTP